MPEGLHTVAVSQNCEHENIYEDMFWLPQVREMEDGLESFSCALRFLRISTGSFFSFSSIALNYASGTLSAICLKCRNQGAVWVTTVSRVTTLTIITTV